ncbi:MAG: YjbH domain-containing protein [Pseudomonadota bacterium]|nr:YjbH domain-containing protein [Pseudomonadota bacterium]
MGAGHVYGATPSLNGQSGYINMPSARVERDGTFSVGYSYDQPYGQLWATSTILPFLQVTGRYVSIAGVKAFVLADGTSDYGRNKDKVFDGKLQLLEESAWRPAIAIGLTDFLGTQLFKGHYLVASKQFGAAHNIDVSVGRGWQRPEGVFAGARWSPLALPNVALVAEYDANNYQKDANAADTSAGKRRKGPALGVEYRWGWLGAQIARHRDHFSANVYATIPLAEREFLPKLKEPIAFQQNDAPPRASLADWQRDGLPGAALVQALAKQDFQNIRVELDAGVLKLMLTNNRIANLGRAIGRASRTALAFAPAGTRSFQITYTKNEQPVATYEFMNLFVLSDYLAGLVTREAFLQTVVVRAATPADRIDAVDQPGLLAGINDGPVGVDIGRDGNMVQLRSEDREANRFRIAPKLGLFFNDPSGALRYELDAAANYDRRLGTGLYLNSALSAKLIETVSGVTQASNSLLPHVRTDIAEYKRGARIKLNKLMVNQYAMPAEHWYGRLSGGLYEEMYRGAGGQLLYVPQDSRWAADLAVDALQQRGYKGLFDARDYRTVTALGALHYRLPADITVTARAGRFLAKDNGVRLEFKRRFFSGMEIGAWYTKTNGKDITNPGTPSNPYNDKGVFVSLSLNAMLLSDTQASANMALSPWTRDVGQMVASPGDLYEMIEKPRRDFTLADGLGNLGERPDEQSLAATYPQGRPLGNPWPGFRLRLEQAASTSPTLPEWVKGGGMAAGAVLVSALFDKPVDRIFKQHPDSALARSWSNFGKAMPVALVGAAGAAMAFGDERMQNIGLISLESVVGAIGVVEAGKYAVGRARPGEDRGPWARVSGGARANAAFPSGHSAVAFAAVTPFAQEYDAPWLYGVAALSAAGRVVGRQHWVSDTVAGSLVGYGIGSWLWQSQRENRHSFLSINPGPKEVSVSWRGAY